MPFTNEYLAEERNRDWRIALRKQLKNKERTDIPRVKMPELDPVERAKEQRIEVNIGLSEDQAVREAARCMDCIHPTCIEGCPVSKHPEIC